MRAEAPLGDLRSACLGRSSGPHGTIPLGPKVWAFALGLGLFCDIRLVGYISIAEILAIISLPCFLFTKSMPALGKSGRRLVYLAFWWLLVAVSTDLYRGAEWAMMARGAGRVVVLAVMLLEFYKLFHRWPTTTSWLLGGAVISSIIRIFGFRAGVLESIEMYGGVVDKRWEVDYAPVTLAFCFWITCWLYKRFPKCATLIVAGVGLVNIAMGSRNLGATMVIAGIVSLYYTSVRRCPAASSVGWFGIARLMFGLGLVATLVYGGYKMAAASGLLGTEAEEKYRYQASFKYGVLMTSRTPFLAGLLAIQASPIVGYGSWAKDDYGFLEKAYALAEISGPVGGVMNQYFRRIPTHSALLEAWVENGILATAFWWYSILIALKICARGAFLDRRWMLFILLTAIWFGWNVLFSPFGARGMYAIVLAFYTVLLDRITHLTTRRSGFPQPTRCLPGH